MYPYILMNPTKDLTMSHAVLEAALPALHGSLLDPLLGFLKPSCSRPGDEKQAEYDAGCEAADMIQNADAGR